MRLGFAGTPQFAVASLDSLAASRHVVAAVYTKPDRPMGRGRSVQSSPVKRRAQELGVPVFQPPNFKTPEAEADLRGLGLDALIVVAYGLILPPAVLGAPRLGCFNVHASLLPRWRGAAPVQRAVLAGDAVTGVTIMRMEEGLDTGPTLACRETLIGPEEMAGDLHDRLAVLGGELLTETVDAIAQGRAREQPQPSTGVLYAHKIEKAESRIDWRQDAAAVARQVRAFNPWPIAETTLDGVQLRIWEAAAVPAPAGTAGPGTTCSGTGCPGDVLAATAEGLDVACGHGVLRIRRLQLPGRKSLPAGEFIRARSLAGARFAGP